MLPSQMLREKSSSAPCYTVFDFLRSIVAQNRRCKLTRVTPPLLMVGKRKARNNLVWSVLFLGSRQLLLFAQLALFKLSHCKQAQLVVTL